MFGRIRVSPSPLESLELEERSPLKIVKQDSLSIYEATLLKLKEGSQRSLSSSDPRGFDSGTANTSTGSFEQNLASCISSGMTLDETSSSCSTALNSSPDNASLGLSSAKPKGRNLTISYLFAKYEGLPRTQNSDCNEAMIVDMEESSVFFFYNK